MYTLDPRRWTGLTPTPPVSTSGSSISDSISTDSTFTVDQPAFIEKCDVGDPFETAYWSALQEYMGKEIEYDFESDYSLSIGEKELEALSLESFDMVDIPLDDESDVTDLKAEVIPREENVVQQVSAWWGAHVSITIPEDQELRDHLCEFCPSTVPFFRTEGRPADHAWRQTNSAREDLPRLFPNRHVIRYEFGNAGPILPIRNAY